ncbi:alkaline phosphatase [Fundidesulfovibrio butyratiphilus]
MVLSEKRKRLVPLLLWLALGLVFATAQARAEAVPGQGRAKYVFLFIGDGMAMTQRSSAEFALAAVRGMEKPGIVKLAMNTLPVQGATTTYSLNSIITDSGAAGTALACGVKTYNGAIGVDGDKTPVESVAEKAKKQGMKVGVVTSVSLDHATPASFYAHQASRNNYYEIALQAADSGFDYFAGGGFKDPEGKRSKKEGDKPDVLSVMKTNGYAVVTDRAAILGLAPGAGKVLAMNPTLDRDKALPYAVDADPATDVSLAEFTAKGVELLDTPKGFFLMVEGGKIDWACHANDAVAAIGDVLALDKAVDVALGFASKHPGETLIVVTGDHETGGLSLGFAGTRYGNYYQYLKHQTMSFQTFAEKLHAYKNGLSGAEPRFEDVAPLISQAFGLKVPTEADLQAMAKSPKPNEDVTSPRDEYGMYLKPYELAMAKAAFARSMAKREEKSNDPEEYLLYGNYDPLTVTLTRLLDAKAGLAWTTYAHTGMPVMTSARGPGAKAFEGYYDNTALSKAVLASFATRKAVAKAD